MAKGGQHKSAKLEANQNISWFENRWHKGVSSSVVYMDPHLKDLFGCVCVCVPFLTSDGPLYGPSWASDHRPPKGRRLEGESVKGGAAYP